MFFIEVDWSETFPHTVYAAKTQEPDEDHFKRR